MVQNASHCFLKLEREDFHLLSGVEQGMRFSQWVDINKLPEFSNLSMKEVRYRTNRCGKFGLIEYKKMQYEGCRLKFEGYDILALRNFVESGVIEGFGQLVGVGKESEVYEVESYKPIVLKYHREGYSNFRKIKLNRDYTSNKGHSSWLYTARRAAEREFKILNEVYSKVRVPLPISQNRHAIVMEMMSGKNLSKLALNEDQINKVLDSILVEVNNTFEVGYVHADLSEHNIFVDGIDATLFDWPQAVSIDHENAEEFLERDISNIISYFERKYPKNIIVNDTKIIIEEIVSGNFNSAMTQTT
jgi:RIO kinase 2